MLRPRRIPGPTIVAWAGAFALVLIAMAARADEATGTWTGAVHARGNYYWERSTRVVAPEVTIEAEAPDGLRLSADYLVDAITSASQAAGTLVDRRFTEIRHQVGLSAGHTFEAGHLPFDLSVSTRVSTEPDYLSVGAGVGGALFLNQRATTLRGAVSYVHDEISEVLRGADRTVDGRNLSDRGKVGELNGVVASVVWDQVVTPSVLTQVGYDFGTLWGFLQNPYRQVSVQGILVDENHPDFRHRHTLFGRVATYLPQTHTSLQALLRSYIDSWDVVAITPEVRAYQELDRYTQLRMRYRHYRQTSAFFYKTPDQYVTGDTLVSADPKMSAFHSHLLGFQLLVQFGFLQPTGLEALYRSRLDLNFDYLWSTSRFGNAIISMVGWTVPF